MVFFVRVTTVVERFEQTRTQALLNLCICTKSEVLAISNCHSEFNPAKPPEIQRSGSKERRDHLQFCNPCVWCWLGESHFFPAADAWWRDPNQLVSPACWQAASCTVWSMAVWSMVSFFCLKIYTPILMVYHECIGSSPRQAQVELLSYKLSPKNGKMGVSGRVCLYVACYDFMLGFNVSSSNSYFSEG